MADMNNEWKVQLGAELKDSAKSEIKTKIRSWNDFVVYIQKVILTSDAKEKIKEQLNGLKGLTPTINSIKISSDAKDGIKNTLVNLKNLNVNVDKVSLANDIGSKIQKQLDALKLNINVNGANVNPNGVGQNPSTPPSKKKSGGIYKTSDLNQKNLAYMTKAYNTIEKQLREIQKLANQQNWQSFDVTGIEQANGLIKSFKINVVDATGAIKQLNFEREKIQTDKGKVYTGFVQEDEVKIIQTATKATEKFLKVQNKAVSDFNNTIKQITSAANDKNATKPITSTESLNRLNTQIKNVDDAMDVLRNSTSDTFDTAKIKVKEEISVLKSLIKELRNADNVSNKLKGTDFTSGKSIAKFNLDKLKVQAKEFPKMEATLKALDDTFDNISDVGSLNNFNDQLTVAQAELSKVKEEVKDFEKAYADAYKELKKLYDLKIEFAKLDNPSQYDESYYNSAINAQEAAYRQAKSKTTTPENWNVQQQNALTHKEYEYQKDLQDAYNKTAYSASELKKVLDNLNNGTYSSQYEVLKNKALSYVDANGQAILSVDKLTDAYNAFTSAKTDTEKVQAARSFTEAYKQLDSQLKTTTTSLDKIVTTQQRLAKANAIESWMQKNTKITGEARTKLEAYVKTLRNTDTAMNKMQFNNITNGFRNIENNMRSIGKLGYSFIDQMEQAAESFTQWISVSAAIMGVVNKTRQAVNELKEVNTLLTEISKANDQLTKDQLANIGNRSFDVASKYGKSATDYLSGVQEASRAGYTNAEEIAELSTGAQGAGDMTAELANQMLIATDKAYKLGGSVKELTKILDGVNYITNHNAVNMSELSEGLSIVGSTAASFGVEANELTAALGTMAATTQQSGSEVARAFRAILLNIRQVSDEEEGIDAEGLTKYENACNALGVSLKETKNGILELRDPMEVLEELAEEYNKLSETDLRRTELLNSVGGRLCHVI